MIWEFGDDENPDWIHVSFAGINNNRGNVLKAKKTESGKIKYSKYV